MFSYQDATYEALRRIIKERDLTVSGNFYTPKATKEQLVKQLEDDDKTRSQQAETPSSSEETAGTEYPNRQGGDDQVMIALGARLQEISSLINQTEAKKATTELEYGDRKAQAYAVYEDACESAEIELNEKLQQIDKELNTAKARQAKMKQEWDILGRKLYVSLFYCRIGNEVLTLAKGNSKRVPKDSANSISMNRPNTPHTPTRSSQRGSEVENSGDASDVASNVKTVPASDGQHVYVLQSSPLSATSSQTPPSPIQVKRKDHSLNALTAKRAKTDNSVRSR
jgi:hypothetical protein